MYVYMCLYIYTRRHGAIVDFISILTVNDGIRSAILSLFFFLSFFFLLRGAREMGESNFR